MRKSHIPGTHTTHTHTHANSKSGQFCITRIICCYFTVVQRQLGSDNSLNEENIVHVNTVVRSISGIEFVDFLNKNIV